MIDVLDCPVCHSKEFDAALVCIDYSISQKKFNLIQCRKCNFLITSPRPDQQELKEYYSSENYISHSDTSRGLINKLYHIVRKITLQSKVSLIKKYFKQPSILDIGSGAGYFLDICKQHGFQVKGIEPDQSSRSRSIKQFDIEVYDENELDKLKSNSFDVISLWHVLEHVEDLNNRIHQIYRLLKPKGVLIIALPNASSYDAKYYHDFWAGYDVPRHLWHFVPETIERLMHNYQFEIIQTIPMYYDAYYVSMLSEKYKKTSFGIIRGVLRGFISNINARWKKSNSYSSQIYIFQKMNKK